MEDLCRYLENGTTPSRNELDVRCDGRTGREKYNMIVAYPLRPLLGKEAKAPPSPRNRLREGTGQPRVGSGDERQVMDFETYPAFFALTPEKQAEVARLVREDAERNASKQAEDEAARVPKELDQQETGKVTSKCFYLLEIVLYCIPKRNVKVKCTVGCKI